MRRSLLLWLHLLRQPRARRPSFGAALAGVARPVGPLVWLHVPRGAAITAAALIARHLIAARPALQILVTTAEGALDGNGLPDTAQMQPAPETLGDIRAFRDQWQPDLGVILGAGAAPALIAGMAETGLPMILANARLGPADAARWRFRRGMARALLSRFVRIMAEDQPSAATLAHLGAPRDRLEVAGQLTEPPEPLRCSEAERASIAAQMRARPVWLATAVPPGELDAVLAAHAHALRHAHRMLLILAPEDGGTAIDLAQRLQAEGWDVACRMREGEPDEDTQIFLTDDPGEYGLWYRLAPVAYMGGTISGTGLAPRPPEEAAALGAAILHGPQVAPHAAQYARLTEARATRAVTDGASLGEAVADLIAPDKAAILAHNAWVVTSGGAGVAERVTRAILAALDGTKAMKQRAG